MLHQPHLQFEGDDVLGSSLKLKGKAEASVPGALHRGDEVYVLVKAHVTAVNHEEVEDLDVLERVHIAKIDAVVVLDGHGADPELLMADVLAEQKRARDAATGQQALT
jgi:hypothetical protein